MGVQVAQEGVGGVQGRVELPTRRLLTVLLPWLLREDGRLQEQ